MVLKNYLYNLMYQVITILLPIITIPYVSRILGADGLGKYALTNAYAQYFVLFGMIGLSIYCSREIAYVRDDKKKLSKTFWELNFLRFVTMGISIVLYIIIFVFIVKTDNKLINIIQTTILLSALVDISWLFIGLENFKKVSIRNTIVKLVGVSLVFIFVKESSQVWLYSLILGGVQFIGQIIMWFDIPKEIEFIYPKSKEMIQHLNFSFKLFIPQMAINIYTMLDKVMLGWLSNEAQVGMYDNSQRIIKISITIVTTLATVTIPKMANLYKNGQVKEFSEYVYKSFSFVSFLAFPMAFGLIGICRNFIPWFYGTGFEGIEPMFYFGSWLMITLAWSSIVGNQVLISIKRDKMFTIAVTTGAIVNVILNFILIRRFEGVGTTISSVVAEFTGMFIMVYFVRDIISPKKLFKVVPKYFMSAFIMFIVVVILGEFIGETIISTIIQALLGIFIYFAIMVITKDNNLIYAVSIVKSKVSSKKTS
ncbi:MAG: oligosaccharide flippase family protein [Clostridium butyricum]|nr:oligosaccharide flippase family protein [Clostridium butyricum]MDU5821852.1 oligosaccharide flippase family protein [Clostridium butyricum]